MNQTLTAVILTLAFDLFLAIFLLYPALKAIRHREHVYGLKSERQGFIIVHDCREECRKYCGYGWYYCSIRCVEDYKAISECIDRAKRSVRRK